MEEQNRTRIPEGIMTLDQFTKLVNQIGNRLGITPEFSHEGEVAHLGEDEEMELHRSGIVRRSRYLYREPVAENIAESIRLQAADRRGLSIRKR